MSNAPLRDWLSSVDDLPDEVVRRLPDFDSWDIAPLTWGVSRVLVIELCCPSCNVRRPLSIVDRVSYQKPIQIVSLRRHVLLHGRDPGFRYAFWFGVCPRCDLVLFRHW